VGKANKINILSAMRFSICVFARAKLVLSTAKQKRTNVFAEIKYRRIAKIFLIILKKLQAKN
jgi:hypothetical protein